MIPANVHPLLMAGNADPLDEYRVIGHSVRFNQADSVYLTRTPGGAGNLSKWTWSGWIKRAALDALTTAQVIFSAGADGNNQTFIGFAPSADKNRLWFGDMVGGGYDTQLISSALFRGVSSHFHLLVSFDAANATAGDRAQIWVNGVRLTAFDTATYTANTSRASYINGTTNHKIGCLSYVTSEFFGGYLSDVYLIDGQALTPASFGAIHPKTNQWRPKAYSGAYGTNGFRLTFSDGSAATAGALGADSSGNGNNWTPTNISVTAGAGNDWSLDTPTNNFCTLNGMDQGTGTLTNGSLDFTTGPGGVRGSAMYPVTGKYYWEFSGATTSGAADIEIGIEKPTHSLALNNDSDGCRLYGSNTRGIKINGTLISIAGGAFAPSDVLQCAYDASTRKVWLGINNTWYDSGGGTTGNPSAGTNATGTLNGSVDYVPYVFGGTSSVSGSVNFGQRAFAYTPPTDFKTLSTKNFPQTGAVTVSGTFTGNANALGPGLNINGTPTTLTINGNAVTFGTHADALSNGFKLRTASASYNTAGANTWTATIVTNIKNIFRHQNARGN